MVDIILAPDCNINVYNGQDDQIHTVWLGLDHLVGYQVYVDDDGAGKLVYRKTVDGGLTWGAPVTISTLAMEPGQAHAVYFGRTTPGIAGRTIHITWTQGATWVYRSLDINTDTLGTVRTIMAPGSAQALHVDIGVARNGDLWAGINANDANVRNFTRRSTNGGVSWADPGGNFIDSETGQDDFFIMPASNTGDDADMWMVYFDDSLNRLELRFWDNSAGSFSSALITSTNWAGQEGAVSVRHSDGHLFIPEHAASSGAHDFRCWEVTDATTFTQRTNILTAVTGPRRAAITIDQNIGTLGRIYVAWLTTTASNVGAVEYVFSDDGAITWTTPLQFSFDALNTLRAIWAAQSIAVGDFGRWMPVWQDQNPEDLETNFDNSLLAGPPEQPPLPPGPFGPGGGSFTRLLSGGAGGFLTYISPQGKLHPLHTPHEFGRWVVSFSGFGTPPIQYVTQRAPFQDGSTVRDFFLRPRVVQLLIRQGFVNRAEWWAGRATLLDDIRPNRQTNDALHEPGVLRLVETDGTTRDLHVFISEGPQFEPRVSTQWDEFAFQEVLRFIAHDPVAFDPARVTATFSVALSANLVFPITFPIQFGSGEVDTTLNINYLGTWLELPVITIVGPLDDFRIDNTTTGEKIQFTADIGPGRTVTIDLRDGAKTVVDDLGNNLIGILTDDSDLGTFHLAPDPEAPDGVNAIRVRGSNPTGATSVTLAYFDRYFGF